MRSSLVWRRVSPNHFDFVNFTAAATPTTKNPANSLTSPTFGISPSIRRHQKDCARPVTARRNSRFAPSSGRPTFRLRASPQTEPEEDKVQRTTYTRIDCKIVRELRFSYCASDGPLGLEPSTSRARPPARSAETPDGDQALRVFPRRRPAVPMRWQAQGERVHPQQLTRQILAQLGVDATGPPIAPVRARPRQESFDLPHRCAPASETSSPSCSGDLCSFNLAPGVA
jgi:hypothetical protein